MRTIISPSSERGRSLNLNYINIVGFLVALPRHPIQMGLESIPKSCFFAMHKEHNFSASQLLHSFEILCVRKLPFLLGKEKR